MLHNPFLICRCLLTSLLYCHVFMWHTNILPRGCDWSIFGFRRNDPCCSTLSYSERQEFDKHIQSNFFMKPERSRIDFLILTFGFLNLGVGIATMALVFFLDIYYCVIIAWTWFYFIAAFTAIPDLPWNTCGKN